MKKLYYVYSTKYRLNVDGNFIYDGYWIDQSDISAPWSAEYVPEPCTLSLLALGGMIMRSKRRG
jgi:hypothetical protein